jgi:hypothetical protein
MTRKPVYPTGRPVKYGIPSGSGRTAEELGAALPQTGHTANLEEPGVFNAAVDRFLAAAERGAWRQRDPRSLSSSTTGMS